MTRLVREYGPLPNNPGDAQYITLGPGAGSVSMKTFPNFTSTSTATSFTIEYAKDRPYSMSQETPLQWLDRRVREVTDLAFKELR